jgi:hypothetical protein
VVDYLDPFWAFDFGVVGDEDAWQRGPVLPWIASSAIETRGCGEGEISSRWLDTCLRSHSAMQCSEF